MRSKNEQGGHYAWDCIGELEGKQLLNTDEKEAVCRKIGSSIYKPSFVVTAVVKVMPFLAAIGLIAGLRVISESATASGYICGAAISAFSLFYMIFALFFYLIKEIWVYDRWKAMEKEIWQKDVYRVPAVLADTFQAGGRHKFYYASLQYREKENFLDTYQITEDLYNHAGERTVYVYYFKGQPEKYRPGKYKLFLIDDGKNTP